MMYIDQEGFVHAVKAFICQHFLVFLQGFGDEVRQVIGELDLGIAIKGLAVDNIFEVNYIIAVIYRDHYLGEGVIVVLYEIF